MPLALEPAVLSPAAARDAGRAGRRAGGRRPTTPWRAAVGRAGLCAVALAVAAPAMTGAAPLRRPPPARPAQAGWQADDLGPLRLIYRPADADAAANLRGRLPTMTAALAEALDAPLPSPLGVRLYSDIDAYLDDHPLARATDAGLAEEHRPRREAHAVVARRADGSLDAAGLDAAVRYALAHQVLAHAADGRLPGGFQEGIARLVTPPTAATQAGVAALRVAIDRDDLVPWGELIGPGAAYVRPEIAYPQSLSMAVFLVETRGFGCLVALPGVARGDRPARAALDDACGVAFEAAEREWLAWLPRYVDGGWRTHPLFDPQLNLARDRLARGDDAAAAALLRAATAVVDDGPTRESARALLVRAEAGAAAAAGLATAEAALAAGDYAAVRHSAAAVRRIAAPVGAAGAVGSADAFDARGRAGLAAAADLARAGALPPWRLFEARRAADRAAAAYARLGNDLAAAAAVERRTALDRRAAPFGAGLAAAGLALVLRARGRPALRAWRARRR